MMAEEESIFTQSMPKLIPVVIPTKGLGFFARYKNWLFGIRRWKFAEDWLYEWDGMYIFIPKGFIMDGASIPRIFWGLLSPTGILLLPGAIHDFSYKYGYIYLMATLDSAPIIFGRKKKRAYWDELFKDIAITVNGFKVINNIAWGALKVGGWRAWNKYRKITSD